MTALRKLRRSAAAAELSRVDTMLLTFGSSQSDLLTRLSLEGREEELKREIESLPDGAEQTASAAVFFGGRPVVGSLGIESEFSGSAISMLQDLVSKQFAHDAGGLGQRGVVPGKDAAKLHVTDVLRGSFGFLLEELQTQGQLVDTSLKASLEAVTTLMGSFASPKEEDFEAAVESADERVLAAARDFFSMLGREGATMRLVSEDQERIFDEGAVSIAANRARITTIRERDRSMRGRLWVLPESHIFELKTLDGIVKGKIHRSISPLEAAQFMIEWLNRDAIAEVSVREVVRDGEVVRQSFTLKSVRAPFDDELDGGTL